MFSHTLGLTSLQLVIISPVRDRQKGEQHEDRFSMYDFPGALNPCHTLLTIEVATACDRPDALLTGVIVCVR